MGELNDLEKPKPRSDNLERKFELSTNPEGKKIREKLEKEYDRRMSIFGNVLTVLEIPKESIILAPPVLDRTDFGYTSDIDFVFLGTDEERNKLYQRLHASFEILPFIVHIDQKRLAEIENELPEFYQFLMQRKGNVPSKDVETEIPIVNFYDEAPELETKARTVLSQEEKSLLKEQRLKIGDSFVNEVRQKVPVLGHTFSGSMMFDTERFGVNSDLDIDLLIDPGDERAEKNVRDWIHVYLKWKYAEEFGIKVDVGDVSLESAHMMAVYDPRFAAYYIREFGIDVSREIER